MKLFYLLTIAIALSAVSFAQTEGASKVYGYKQKLMGGTVRLDQNGNEIPRQPRYNYFIYLASPTAVNPVEIWINGEAYSATVRDVASPVEYTHPTSGDNKPKILVPKTTSKIVQLGPSANKIQHPTSKGKALSSKNELVVIYKANGKLYYKDIKSLAELPPLSMQ